ncbi:peptidyl-tRNA hydrolase [Cryptococcus wingfieldii CBS 7118]|uniref:peptidyl-tRNA hydrolase n=1 Tax=Cryptococcus wingfieldii CBS 7118 TaxID=1295528 RepID=A0A1E3J1X6_9TREE|nr:peptidyl-tRNA hydrolase [Cryptococcus wingfieldii CBS 7118]ODN94832.1 peptidyl-tRNA hydrolase [Cryptococcus wingfieldii CBS 7118]
MSSAKMEVGLVPSIVVSIITFALGYHAHNYFSAPTPLEAPKSKPRSPRKFQASESQNSDDDDSLSDAESDSSDASSAVSNTDLTAPKWSSFDEMKLVLVVNDELKMTKGKIAAQAGHATLACALTLKEANPKLFKAWQMQGQPKIALRTANTEELEILAAQARSVNLCARTIRDAQVCFTGRTQVAPGSKTIVGIGPGPAKLINSITGKLKLL